MGCGNHACISDAAFHSGLSEKPISINYLNLDTVSWLEPAEEVV